MAANRPGREMGGGTQTAKNSHFTTPSDPHEKSMETAINGLPPTPVRARMTHRNDPPDACRLAHRHDLGAHTPKNRAKKAP